MIVEATGNNRTGYGVGQGQGGLQRGQLRRSYRRISDRGEKGRAARTGTAAIAIAIAIVMGQMIRGGSAVRLQTSRADTHQNFMGMIPVVSLTALFIA